MHGRTHVEAIPLLEGSELERAVDIQRRCYRLLQALREHLRPEEG